MVWGHSLGTGIATKMGSELAKESSRPDAFVLEAAFSSIFDAVMTHRIARLFNYLGVDITRLVQETGLQLESQKWIGQIPEPVLMFHAEDDW